MLRRIILIVAIIAALAAVGINIGVVRPKIMQLQADRDDQRSAKETAQHQLSETRKTLAATQTQLTQTQQQLTDAQTARDNALHKLIAANTQIKDLTGKLATATQERDTAQDNLAAYKATGLSPDQVVNLNKQLNSTENALDVASEEKLVLTHAVARLQNQVNELLGVNTVVTLPASLKGTVMAVDPKWDFVVLNVGEDQGVLDDGELLVSRDGKLVAKVVVRSVLKDRCIANIMPGWQLGDVIEGDEVIPAHPAS